MPLLRMNATDQGLQVHHTGSDALSQIVQTSPETPGPAIVMIHGYKYDPGTTQHCPHRKLFGPGGADWAGGLGFGDDAPDSGLGLGIAFGWSARGGLKQVHRRAADLGASLAELVHTLKNSAPLRPVHVVAHSLGSEIALAALAHLPQQSIDRMLLLTGASFAGTAERMLATPAGKTTEVFNMTSRENDVFDLAFEALVRPARASDRAIGQGISRPNVANIQLDCDRTLSVLASLGACIGRAERTICHWSSYTRPGIMAFYSELLRQPDKLTFDDLRQTLPDSLAPRWSRLAVKQLTGEMPYKTADTLAAVTQVVRRKAAALAPTTVEPKGNKPAF